MITKIKNKIYILLPFILIIYFILNIFGGNRGLFSYMDKTNYFNKLEIKKISLKKKIYRVEKSNSLLSDNLDIDYIEILLRDKFMLGKKGESIYIISDE
tara:strand:+ start:109 stop:405 length:297 start_codon:yes stop_codon:yes gene_type:complete